ncbi:methionyl-tRNA formyltransferase [Panacagrimonas sp.]|uniref:methionyl-tRNA formyltransferase n=1 Tax=Panacagrimonas sp. TaxID=2480088 RepID=UPI003B52504C
MRLVFAGTPAFAVPALQALAAAGHDIVGVYTQPDRPAGRGRKLSPSAVAECAARLRLSVFKPEKLRGDPTALAQLAALRPQCMVVVAYGLILPQAVLDIPDFGCLNIHASLLPRWRGAAPVQRAILAGDVETGVTIMQMDAGLDTGPMLLRRAVPIPSHSTAGELQDRLSTCGAELIVQALQGLQAGTLSPQAQPAQGVTYAAKLSKLEARLDWSLHATELLRRVHGYNPAPGAWCECGGERLKVLRAQLEAAAPPPGCLPGHIVAADERGWIVASGAGLLRISEVQRPGGRAMPPWSAYGSRPPPTLELQ